MLEKRAEPEVCTSQGKLYVCGGSLPLEGHVHTSIELFEPSTRTWTMFAHMRVPRKCFAVAVCEGRIYMMGGYRQLAHDKAEDSVECMDLVSRQGWELEPMGIERGGLAVGLLSVAPSGSAGQP